jgi:hypothetical protein
MWFENVVSLSNDGKLIAQMLRLQMHIMLQEQVLGALQEVTGSYTVAVS